MKDERELLAEFVKLFKKQHNLNQIEFGAAVDLDKDTISKIEKGEANFRLTTLQKIAAYTGDYPSDLISLNPKPYVLIPNEIDVEGRPSNRYGMGVVDNFVMTDFVLDVSGDLQKMNELIMRCNEFRASPCHLRDIAEDACLEELLI